jgi:thiol:disulfide interchange protein DsbC
VATALALSACSKENSAQKQDTLTASAPATGEASTLSERNAQQRLITTLQQQFKKANIQAKIIDIKPTEVPNLYWVNLEGMSSVYATSDGKYIIQGEVIRLGDKELTNVGDALQASENKKLFAALKTEDLIVYPATNGKAKHVIYVFTDSSCPYCHKLHEHLSEITAKGLKFAILHGLVVNNLCQPCKQSGVVKTVKLHLINLFKAYRYKLHNVKTLCMNNINWV